MTCLSYALTAQSNYVLMTPRGIVAYESVLTAHCYSHRLKGYARGPLNESLTFSRKVFLITGRLPCMTTSIR